MALFKKREVEVQTEQQGDALLQAILSQTQVTREQIMNIPAVNSCINLIGDTIAALQIKMYKKEEDKIEEVQDYRTSLLNDETGDTLDGYQFKKALITDMFLARGGYAYLNKAGNTIKSIHYVDASNVSFQEGTNHIFKDYYILVDGQRYEAWDFIKLVRSTKNGYYGKSIIEESQLLLSILYSSQVFEQNLVKTGGNKKGFIQATSKLSKDAMDALKKAFKNLYSNNSENVVILNDGLTFKESSNTSVELQLNQNKQTNNNDICKVFLVPPSLISGGATEEDKKQFYELCILPILKRFITAINSVMLNESEKGTYFFDFDTTDILKSDIEKRFNAYKVALDSGFMQIDEVRKNEKMPSFDLDFLKLGLQDVLYFPETKEVYTPNTNKYQKMGESELDIEQGPSITDDQSDPGSSAHNITDEEGGE